MDGYKGLLRTYFSAYVRDLRRTRGLTQEEMAERLHISSRAYSDLERGKYSLSTTTLLFLLLMLDQDEQRALLSQFQQELFALERGEVA